MIPIQLHIKDFKNRWQGYFLRFFHRWGEHEKGFPNFNYFSFQKLNEQDNKTIHFYKNKYWKGPFILRPHLYLGHWAKSGIFPSTAGAGLRAYWENWLTDQSLKKLPCRSTIAFVFTLFENVSGALYFPNQVHLIILLNLFLES